MQSCSKKYFFNKTATKGQRAMDLAAVSNYILTARLVHTLTHQIALAVIHVLLNPPPSLIHGVASEHVILRLQVSVT